jgi:hypothetical protein
MIVDLRTKQPIGDEPEPQAPCIFCGKVIGHINDCKEVNDNHVGCVAGAIVDGEVKHFLYCNDPICPEHQAARDAGEGITDCSCEDYRAYDVVVGYNCHVCGKPPCDPGQAPWLRQDKPGPTPKCLWCETPLYISGTPVDGLITVVGLEVDGEVRPTSYCSGDCLFHWLLAERANGPTFTRVQELLCLPEDG